MVNPIAVVMRTTNRRATFTTHRTIQRFAPWGRYRLVSVKDVVVNFILVKVNDPYLFTALITCFHCESVTSTSGLDSAQLLWTKTCRAPRLKATNLPSLTWPPNL